MNNTTPHIEPDDFFKKVKAPFDKTKEEAWESLTAQMDDLESLPAPVKKVHMHFWQIAAAAVLVLFVSTIAFARFYTKQVTCNYAQRVSHTLPDGSVVDLNAGSSITYLPYWWFAQRKVQLAGEAFFAVQKGKRFTVLSDQGSTEVMGTSFNIYARENLYQVFCKTGKVRVTRPETQVELILHPTEMAVVNADFPKGKIQRIPEENVLGWKQNKFFFDKTPLSKVVAELERQYNISISWEDRDMANWKYSGYFTQTPEAEHALLYVCTSFNITFEQIKPNVYRLIQKP